ncbi:MAG: glycosyltransferase family 39 protein [Candidatus Diapherotrites archaeon]|nr:glycosyltransferase family 39 protein [Candidatus Diapherotrites archaeon]
MFGLKKAGTAEAKEGPMKEGGKGAASPKFDLWTGLIALIAVLFVLVGFVAGWAGVYWAVVFQPVLFGLLFLLVLKKGGLGKEEFAFLAIILLLGYALRTQNFQPRFQYFFGFDPFFASRMMEFYLVNGQLPPVDPLGYFELPDASRVLPTNEVFFYYICVGVFKLFTMFGPYSRELLVEIVKILPAFYGTIICILCYFVGKELWGKKAGYVTAFLAAVMPAYVYRTAEFESDALGFFWLVGGLLFFLRALKEPKLDKSHIINALLAGILFAGMAATWGFFLIIPILLILFFPFGLLLFASQSNSRSKTVAFAGLYLLASLAFASLAVLSDGTGWFGTMLDYSGKALPFISFAEENIVTTVIVTVFLALIFGFFLFLLFFGIKDAEGRQKLLRGLVVLALYAVVVFVIIAVLDPNGMFSSRIQSTDIFMSTVGEEGAGNPHFGYKYGILVWFAYAALALMPLYVWFNKKDYLSPVVFLWIASSLLMAWYKLKFTYIFGLPMAFAGGAVAGIIFYYFKDLKNFKALESKIVIFALAFMMLGGFAMGLYFATQNEPNIEVDPLWKSTLFWMKDNTPAGAKYLNWWSYGHWITFVAGKSVFADNRNVQWDISDGGYGKFLMAQDLNESLELANEWKPDYILVDNGLFQGFSSMATYAFQTKPSDFDKNSYLLNLLMFAQPPNAGSSLPYANFQYPCQYVADKNAYNCVVYEFPEKSFATLPDAWSLAPLETENGVPVWDYREEDNSGFARMLSTVNNSTLAKLWFHDPEAMKYFEEIYKASSGTDTIKIFRVKKEAFGWGQ